jgi:hypothetical protein
MRTGPRGTEWIVASSRELKLSKTKASLKAVLESKEYGVFKRSGDFALFKRGYNADGNAKLMKDWGLGTTAPEAREAPPEGRQPTKAREPSVEMGPAPPDTP